MFVYVYIYASFIQTYYVNAFVKLTINIYLTCLYVCM